MIFPRAPENERDNFAIVSAIWILACNDENPIITYRGLENRLALPPECDVKEIVLGHRELFRPGILQSRLDEWKAEMRQGRRLPGWISEIKDAAERQRLIDPLTRDDMFRSQFRAEHRAPKSPLDILDWGLEHIDRLRKATAERRAERERRISQLITFGSVIIALISVAVSWVSIHEQSSLKRFELTFAPKQKAYSEFLSAFDEAFLATLDRNPEKVNSAIGRMHADYYLLEPFLSQRVARAVLLKLNEFSALCASQLSPRPDVISTDDDRKALTNNVGQFKAFFSDALYSSLFK